MGEPKWKFGVTDVLASHRRQLICQIWQTTVRSTVYQVTPWITETRHRSLWLFRIWNWENGVSRDFLNFYEDVNETAENIKKKKKFVAISSKYKLYFADLSAYWQTGQMSILGSSIRCLNFLPNKLKQSHMLNTLYTLSTCY